MNTKLENTMGKANDIIELLLNTFPSFGIILIFILIGMIFWHTHKIGKLDWSDLITSKGSDIISLSKCLQLIGGVTGTWMVVFMTLHDKLTFDILLVYLGYVGSVEGFSKFLSAKYGVQMNTHEQTIDMSKPNVVTETTTDSKCS
jgi:hypothetical protein